MDDDHFDLPEPGEEVSPEEYDRWFRDKVERALASTEPTIPHEQVMEEINAMLDRQGHASARLGS